MKKTRLIARVDVKNDFAIKGIQLEGLRKIGNPNDLCKKYYTEGIDEIIFMDAVAAYYDRNSLTHIIRGACVDVFVPITVGGGIRTLKDISDALSSGADKVAINTQAIRNPSFISEMVHIFGAQCIVGSIEAKKVGTFNWEAYTDNGREPSNHDAVEWAKRLEELGVGEIMVTSVDRDGTKKGFDIDLVKSVAGNVSIPVIASGGAGKCEDVLDLLEKTNVDAVACASIFHFNRVRIADLRKQLLKNNIAVRS